MRTCRCGRVLRQLHASVNIPRPTAHHIGQGQFTRHSRLAYCAGTPAANALSIVSPRGASTYCSIACATPCSALLATTALAPACMADELWGTSKKRKDYASSDRYRL